MGSLGYIEIEIKFDILGVFLLNAVLTVEAKKSNSHKVHFKQGQKDF